MPQTLQNSPPHSCSLVPPSGAARPRALPSLPSLQYLCPLGFRSQSTANPLKVIADTGISCYLLRSIYMVLRDFKNAIGEISSNPLAGLCGATSNYTVQGRGKISSYCVLTTSQALCQRPHRLFFHLLREPIRNSGSGR